MPEFDQDLFYHSLRGRLLGSLAREKEVMKLLNGVKVSDSILEVGCSEGHYLHKLKDKTIRSVGLDVVEEKINEAKRRNAKSEFYVFNGRKIPFRENEFDWVLCTEVLEHVPQWKALLKEIKRVAKKFIVLTIPLEKSFWWSTASKLGFGMKKRGHVHALKCQDIERQMNGFALRQKKLILTPFVWLNELMGQGREESALYAAFLYEKIDGSL